MPGLLYLKILKLGEHLSRVIVFPVNETLSVSTLLSVHQKLELSLELSRLNKLSQKSFVRNSRELSF